MNLLEAFPICKLSIYLYEAAVLDLDSRVELHALEVVYNVWV